MIADKGFWGSGYDDRLADDGVTLLMPDKARIAATSAANANALPPDSASYGGRSGVADREGLRQPQRSDATRATSPTPRPAGLAFRIAQRILALTLGIVLNTFNGRPARALAADDGR